MEKEKVADKSEKLIISGKPDSGVLCALHFPIAGSEKVDFLPSRTFRVEKLSQLRLFFFLLLELISGERLKLAKKFQRESVQLASERKVNRAAILRGSATFSRESKRVDLIE